MSNLSLAFKSFFSLLFSGKLPEDVQIALNLTRRIVTPGNAKPAETAAAPKPAPVVEAAKAADGAVQILAILQREARLIDFLEVDITPFTD